jgi:hypothetical protein
MCVLCTHWLAVLRPTLPDQTHIPTQVDVAVLQPEKPVTPSDVDEQLAKLNAELDSRSANGSSSTPASSLVNKAMEVSGWDHARGGGLNSSNTTGRCSS